ncbi:hypothetical protein LT493_20810 [Streptomyces tricolor]|nr:hypothetical protein [Streptomyces tricolor]
MTLAAVVHIAGLATTAATVLLGPWPHLKPVGAGSGPGPSAGVGQGLQLPLYFRFLLAAIPDRPGPVGQRAGGHAPAVVPGGGGRRRWARCSCRWCPGRGMRRALAVVLAVQAAGLLGLAALGLRLPGKDHV